MGSPEAPSGELPGGNSAPAPSTQSTISDSNVPAKAPEADAAAAAGAAVAEWSKTLQAFYGPGAVMAPQAFYPPPPPWGAQMMGHYGPPGAIAYAPFYAQPPPGAIYAQQHPLPLGVAYPEGMMNKSSGSKGTAELAGNSGRGISGSRDNAARSGDSDTVGSSDTREEGGEDKNPSTTKKRTYDMLAAEAETTNPTTPGQYVGAESSYSGRVRSAKKLPVSAPGRTTLPDPQTNLSIGMDIWDSTHTGPATIKVESGEQQWLQDERDLRRERRKQSNRESARRSRLRKQQECEDLGRRVSELTDENNSLRVEVANLKKFCDELTAENKSLEEDLTRQHGPNFLLVLGVGAHPSTNGHFHHNPPSTQKDGTSGDNLESTSS